MNLRAITLVNFRSYSRVKFDFGDTTVVVGGNGSGKSNLLEAVYLLAVGKSFRAERDDEMIRYGENHAIVQCQISDDGELKVILADRKRFEVNGVPRRMIDAVGKAPVVLFAPQDLELVTGSPAARRRYLDFVIGQTDREYRRSLISYEKGLRQRNKLLEMVREGVGQRSQLYFWDRLLIKNGQYLSLRRGEYLTALGDHPDSIGDYSVTYDRSVISEGRLKRYEQEEVAAAATLVGPHRDDFVVQILNSKFKEPKDVSKFGSRGEQRLAVLWLKQGELKFLDLGSRPTLLLDDIFSELDQRHRRLVSDMVDRHRLSGGQVIVTSADEHLISDLGGVKINL